MTTINRAFAICLLALLLSACSLAPDALSAAAQAPGLYAADGPGFFTGLWHGLITPIALVVSLFDHDVAFYAIPNNGGGYNLGFLLGIWQWPWASSSTSRVGKSQ